MRRLLFRALCLFAPALCGCGSDVQTLEGSLGTLVSLDYTGVELVTTGAEWSLRFVDRSGAGENTPLKVTVQVGDLALLDHAPIDLADPTTVGGLRTSVTRDVLDDPRRTLPEVARGSLMVTSLPLSGQRTSGEFNVTFAQGTQFGSGRTVFGPFEATVP